MVPPSWVEVPAALAAWLDDLGVASGGDRPIEALAVAHASFERIHPFLDGNGRAGRLLLNLMLVRLGYAPAIIYKRDRSRYLDALRSADAGDAGPLGELLARAVLDNLYRFIVPAVAGPNRLVPLAALATDELSEGALRTAANRGRLRGQEGRRRTLAINTGLGRRLPGPTPPPQVTDELPPRVGRRPSPIVGHPNLGPNMSQGTSERDETRCPAGPGWLPATGERARPSVGNPTVERMDKKPMSPPMKRPLAGARWVLTVPQPAR